MAPKSTSSASSATRKKQARKAVAKDNPTLATDDSTSMKTGKQKSDKKDKKAPKVKQFVPPPVYSGDPDPVDILKLGLYGSPVGPDRVVMLRKVGKKDPVTIERGLEEWVRWARDVLQQQSNSSPASGSSDLIAHNELLETIPVLTHHFPRLALHPSRRVRNLLLSLHRDLLNDQFDEPNSRDYLLAPSQLEQPEYLASWLICTCDSDKAVRLVAEQSWTATFDMISNDSADNDKIMLQAYASEILQYLIPFINPPTPAHVDPLASATSCPRKLAILDESLESTTNRIRASALEGLVYLLSTLRNPEVLFVPSEESIMRRSDLWEMLLPYNKQDPNVRKALWNLVHTISKKEVLQPLLQTATPFMIEPVLHSALCERDFGVQGTMILGITSFTSGRSDLWIKAERPLDPMLPESPHTPGQEDTCNMRRKITDMFFSYLESACSANPILLYPALVVLLTSFPSSMFTPSSSPSMSDFFVHFWSAYSSRLLRSTGVLGLSAFHHASADALIFFDKRSSPGSEVGLEIHFRRMWNQLLSGSFQFLQELDALIVAISHVAQKSPMANVYIWPVIFETTDLEMDQSKLIRCLTFLNKAYAINRHNQTSQQLFQARKQLFSRAITAVSLSSFEQDDAGDSWVPIITICISEEATLLQAMDESIRLAFSDFTSKILPQKFWTGLASHHDLFYACLSCQTCGLGAEVWCQVVKSYSAHLTMHHIPHLLQIIQRIKNVSSTTQLPPAGLDKFVLECTTRLIQGDSSPVPFIQSVLVHPEPLIMADTAAEVLNRLGAGLHAQMTKNLSGAPSPDLPNLHLMLQAYAPYFTESYEPRLTLKSLPANTVEQIGITTYMIANFWGILYGSPACDLAKLAQTVYTALLKNSLAPSPESFFVVLLGLLQKCIVDSSCQIHPFDLIEASRRLINDCPALSSSTILSGLPVGSSSDSPLTQMVPLRRNSPLLMIHDPLVSQNCVFTADPIDCHISLTVSYDRIVLAVLNLLAQDRILAQANCWLWEHCMYLGQWTLNSLQLSTFNTSDQDSMTSEELEAIISVIDMNLTYLISSLAHTLTPQWHVTAITHLKDPTRPTGDGNDQLIVLLGNLVLASRSNSTEIIAAQSLRKVLSLIFKHANSQPHDLERWLSFARSAEEWAPSLSLAVLHSIKPYLTSTQAFQQYQNTTAGRLTDVPVSKVNTLGLRLVKFLHATAPPIDSPHIFLPQRRCILLLQTLTSWLKDADDIDFELIARMLELFTSLLPIIQTVQGSHWPSILDLVAINLEASCWDEETSLVPVWHACLLIKAIQDLSKRNETLKTAVSTSLRESYNLVYNLFVLRPVDIRINRPIESISRAIEDILIDPMTPGDPLDRSVEKLVQSIFSRSVTSSTLAYTLARKLVQRDTDTLSIEAELTQEASIDHHAIPDILLNMLDKVTDHDLVAHLLGWLLVFTYFENASLRLKNAYNAQLREMGLIPRRLVPLLHGILRISDRGKAYDVSIWDITQFNTSFIDECESSPIALAAFVYCTALHVVPAHIRTWWEECRNKQLSLSVASFCTRHFSPLLIGRELRNVKEQASGMELEDEQMSLKVNTMANEVKVSYMVDEESMEIVVKIPSQYPLQSVEVLDIRKVGVPDAMWRAWILSIQHTIASQNGSITEALALFKKNVSLHFEGVEACAICYSIISVVDRSLPSKACRTCHNRFHPSCIFKWFATSHGSSCPLCRSLF
ncbi:hypothetical protein DFH28DRAFT_1160381 [Melampsora americana]|nr:hypothetical protein DFH28DRAFT_1160381 [Melampsora americana]